MNKGHMKICIKSYGFHSDRLLNVHNEYRTDDKSIEERFSTTGSTKRTFSRLASLLKETPSVAALQIFTSKSPLSSNVPGACQLLHRTAFDTLMPLTRNDEARRFIRPTRALEGSDSLSRCGHPE
ncbi:hypothetical protein CEXT_619041 [Caerostris extrusa]|uniref:Uncharacterized protein n=1 Tax=Caerostris extrusa TaxID=172846 RepID=A0AAV4T7Y7_CAEEX|nr:hypothetical protein CEXT_619041 [Caerostris extrusa]